MFLLVLVVVTMPLALVRRYRAGTATRPARGWMAALNLAATAVSAFLLLLFAAISGIWIPNTLLWTAGGLAGGALLGLLGLAMTRWQVSPGAISYTPPRLLILTITVVVTARLLYGFLRMWNAWRATPEAEGWIAASGAAGSMAAGAVVLGYYLMYWSGLLRSARRHGRLTLRGR